MSDSTRRLPMGWKNERHFDDYRKGLKVTVGVDPDGDLGILWQDSLRKGQEYSIIIAGHEALALAEHINEMYGYSGIVDATIATLTAERDARDKQVRELVEEALALRTIRLTKGTEYCEVFDQCSLVEALAAQLKEQDDE